MESIKNPLAKRSVDAFMAEVLKTRTTALTAVEFVIMLNDEAHKLYNSAHSDGERQYTSDKIIEQIKG